MEVVVRNQFQFVSRINCFLGGLHKKASFIRYFIGSFFSIALTNIEVPLTFSINFVHVNQAKNGESWKMFNEDATIVFLYSFSYLKVSKNLMKRYCFIIHSQLMNVMCPLKRSFIQNPKFLKLLCLFPLNSHFIGFSIVF